MNNFQKTIKIKPSKGFDFFIFIFLISIQNVFCQDYIPRNSSGIIEYSEVVLVDSCDKLELYNRCKKWFAKYYMSAQNVLQVDTKDNLMGKAVMVLVYSYGSVSSDMLCGYTIDISIKDNKYKYVISDFLFKNGGSMEVLIENGKTLKDKKAQKAQNLVIEQFKEHLNNLIKNLKLSMSSKKDAW